MNTSSISCREAHALLNQGAQLVDVRSPAEFSQGALEGAINLPVQYIYQAVSTLDPDQPVIAYCLSGQRSAQATAMLSQLGFDARNAGPARNLLC